MRIKLIFGVPFDPIIPCICGSCAINNLYRILPDDLPYIYLALNILCLQAFYDLLRIMNKAKLNPRTGGKSSTLNKKTASMKSPSVPKPKPDPVEQKEIKNQKKCCVLQ